MADLAKLQEFAALHGFGLTAPLTHSDVVALAEYWLPEIRFHEKERFHPIALDELFGMVDALYTQLPPEAQKQWQIEKVVRTGANEGAKTAFDPPLVYVPDGVIEVEDPPAAEVPGTGLGPDSPDPTQPAATHSEVVVRVLASGVSAVEGLGSPEAGTSTIVTHGGSYTRSLQFFGAKETRLGGEVPAPGDPYQPRATGEDGAPRISVLASYLNLMDLLKYELAVAADATYPSDGLRRGFDVVDLLFRSTESADYLPSEEKRRVLEELIEAYEAGDSEPFADLGLPAGWSIDRLAWDAVTRFAFLEFGFLYAYNDWEYYQTTPFDNEHEGDDEGCCLVFDLNAISDAFSGGASEPRQAIPHSLITSVHEPWLNADLFKAFPLAPADPSNTNPRSTMGLRVYVAGGSHATYLTPGAHDLVDFGDTMNYVGENCPIVLAFGPALVPILLIVAMVEHFIDTEDFTSDDGIHAGPQEVITGDSRGVATRVIVLPMTAGEHIYLPRHEQLLRLRAFAGKWGSHDGLIDHSPQFLAKTGRFFRTLLKHL